MEDPLKSFLSRFCKGINIIITRLKIILRYTQTLFRCWHFFFLIEDLNDKNIWGWVSTRKSHKIAYFFPVILGLSKKSRDSCLSYVILIKNRCHKAVQRKNKTASLSDLRTRHIWLNKRKRKVESWKLKSLVLSLYSKLFFILTFYQW